MSRNDDSLSRYLGRGRRRKMRNLRDMPFAPGASVVDGGTDTGDDDTDLPDDGGTDTGGSDDCGGGLGGCEELAAAEVCIESGSGAASRQVGCVVDVLDTDLEPGDTVAWAADVKCTMDSGNEVNPAGTLKMTSDGKLVRDALDTLDGVTVENGTVEIVQGKLRASSDGEWRYTGISNRAEISVQVRKQSSTFQDHHFVGRMTSGLNGYSVQQNEFEDSAWEILGGAENGQLWSDPDLVGKPDNYRDVLKIHVKDDQQRFRIGSDSSSQAYDTTTTDADRNGETGTFGAVNDPTAASATTYFDAIACPNDEITCTNLPTDYSIRVGDLEAQESSGTATLDLEGTLYPSPFPIEVLDDSGDIVESWMPPSGFYGGAVFDYSSGGAFTPDDATGQIDLDIFDSTGVLLQTATTGQTTSDPVYRRLTGTVDLPPSSRFLAPTLRRAGTATAVVCSRRVTVRAGSVAPWIPCEDAGDVSERHIVPTDEKKVLDLRFTNKYPKVASSTNMAGFGTPKADGDGTIALSRKIFDASIWKLHHHLNTYARWNLGPSGANGSNPTGGDWVADWPRPVAGTRGWASRLPCFGDYYIFDENATLPSGNFAYVADDDDDVRGPEGEFNVMSGFSYIFWIRPIMETFWDNNLASVFESSNARVYDTTLSKYFNTERGGWRFVYEWNPIGSDSDHEIWFESESEIDSFTVLWQSGDNGPCDLFFGVAADDSLHDFGIPSAIPAFVALTVSEATDPGNEYLVEHEGDDSTVTTISDATPVSQVFTAPADMRATYVSLRMKQKDAVSYTDESLEVTIYDDVGGSPGSQIGVLTDANVAVSDLPDSASSPEWIRLPLEFAVDLTNGTDYHVHVEATNVDGSHRVELYGSATIIAHRVEGFDAPGTVEVNVWTGNGHTGELRRLGAANSVVTTSGPQWDDQFPPQNLCPAPRTYTAYDNMAQHVIGCIKQQRRDSLRVTQSGDSAAIIVDAVVRHNRVLSEAEVRGAFIAGQRHEWELSTPLMEADVDSSGESASEVSAP